MERLKLYAVPALRMFYGALFIASAILKLFPIEAFELVLIKQVGFSWAMAPMMARLLIIIEFALGVSIGFGFMTKKMLWVSLLMLGFFTVYLVLLIIDGSGAENCGCFGELIPMDAPTSIGKNLVIAVIAVVLLWQSDKLNGISFKWAGPSLAVLFIPIIFLALPLPEGDLDKEATLDSEVMSGVNADLDWDLLSGEKVIVVMYSQCIHCAQLASLISTAQFDLTDSKMRLLIYGSESTYEGFLRRTKTEGFPARNTKSRSLMQAIEGTVPTVIAVKDGKVTSNWTGREVNIDLLVKLMQNTEPSAYE